MVDIWLRYSKVTLWTFCLRRGIVTIYLKLSQAFHRKVAQWLSFSHGKFDDGIQGIFSIYLSTLPRYYLGNGGRFSLVHKYSHLHKKLYMGFPSEQISMTLSNI